MRAAYVRAIAPGFVKVISLSRSSLFGNSEKEAGGGEELKSHKEEKRVGWFV